MNGGQATPGGSDRRRRRRRASHARIRSAARLLFRERGFDATTVDEIAARADIAQKTFFNHFASKDALLDELAGAVLAHFERLLEFECKRSDSVELRLDGFFLSVASEIEEARILTRDLLHRIIRGASVEASGSLELERVRKAFRQILIEGRERGEVATAPSLEFQVDMVSGAFITVMLQWLNAPEYPLRERLRETARFLSFALVSFNSGPKPLASEG